MTMTLSANAKQKILIIAAGFIMTLAAGLGYVQQPLFCKFLNNKIYDIILGQVHNPKTSGVPVIVDIDEKSLQQFGQWPWPRYRLALLLGKIGQTGALAVGMDVLFAEQDRSSLHVLKKELKRDLLVDINFTGIPSALEDNDKIFANILAGGPYVLGYFFDFGSEATVSEKISLHPVNPSTLTSPGASGPLSHLLKADGVIAPLPLLAKAAKNSGFFNTMTDDDGIVRSLPLLISWQDKIYPSLAVATLQTALNNPVITLKTTSGGIESMRTKGTVIPLDRNGRFLIHYRGAGQTFPSFSAADIFNDKIKPGELKNKIVLIGTSAAGLKDLRPTPLNPMQPGVEIHATVIDNILTGDFFSRPDWAPGLEFCMIIVSGLIISILIAFSNAKWTLPITLISGFAMWYCGIWFMESKKIFVSSLFPIFSLAGNFSLLTLLKFWVSEQEKRFFRTAFSRYVSPSIVEQISNSHETLSLKGEEKELSVLFSDVRGFTSLSEQLTPTQVIDLLHDYFTPMTKAIIENEGTLDKFIGDAVMAFWNAPVTVENHKTKSVKSGIDMLRALGILNKAFQEKFGFQINIGIGLHSGVVRVGNMGTDDLFDYTIIGDDVNLASRLEGLTKFYGVRIIISETMINACPSGFLIQELDMVSVKGRETPLKIYGIYSGHYAKYPEKELPFYNEALEAYRSQDFNEALAMFSALKNEYIDRRLYSIYQERCEIFIETPPPPDWDTVFRHTSK